jgi:hypothetical protein
MESEETGTGTLGAFNPRYPGLAPFLSGLARSATVFTDFETTQYTGWSVSSMFTAQCGLPEVTGHSAGKANVLAARTCVGDFLRAANVSLFNVQTALESVNFGALLEKHGWRDEPQDDHGQKRDLGVVEHITRNWFPKLERMNDAKQRWVFQWTTQGVHVQDNLLDPDLPNRVGEGADQWLRGWDQADQVIEKFFRAFEAAPFANDTDFLIYGDHIHVQSPAWLKALPRRMLLMLPLHEAKVHESLATLYDIGPTILDLMGVCFEPAFPWGRSLLRDPDKPATFPQGGDFRLVAAELGAEVVETRAWNPGEKEKEDWEKFCEQRRRERAARARLR